MSEKKVKVTMEKIVSLSKRRGFVFHGSEIYGGLANTWDYGPYGVELKNNVKKAWWKYFVQERDDIVGLDAAILMHPKTWEASGHVGGFSDPLMDCKECKERFRADKLIEEKLAETDPDNANADGWAFEEMQKFIQENNIVCPTCGKLNWTDIRQFNLMFKTHQGVLEDDSNLVYLRPETAQGIFVNFKNVQQTSRKKLPFGIAQIGKAFRNEITPGNFTFRTREFEQMEIEYFVSEDMWEEKYAELKGSIQQWFRGLGIEESNIRWRKHDDDELSHYSKMTYDIEYKYPFGWGELHGFAYRTNFDLAQHAKFSGADLNYFDEQKNEKFIPHCIEPSFGCDRTALVFLIDAYDEEEIEDTNGKKETRVVMRFHKDIAPIKIAILPLQKKLKEEAKEVFAKLSKHWMCEFDVTGSIGKRYRRQDEIGTPYCLTFDFDSLEDGMVTIRDRDTMEQERVEIEDLENIMREKLSN